MAVSPDCAASPSAETQGERDVFGQQHGGHGPRDFSGVTVTGWERIGNYALRFDFSDTFSEGFYYDSIRSTAWIKDGVMHTDDTLVDGLEADIAMKGSVNLVRRELDMEAVVAPEISASVGVAAAFVVNPIVGAAVFAASKVLGPLWSKVSILRYRITGPVDKPQINEVLRQPRKDAQQ